MTRPPLPTRRPFALRPVSLAVVLLGTPAAFALPQGGVPTFGQTQTQTTAPGQLTITQGSARAGIDWTSFSIAAGERVLIQQPGRDSVLVNRVVGQDPSLIFGQMQSNGSVWLVNPRGIVFGAGSRVDVGGLVATTLDVRNAENGGNRLELSRNEGGSGEIRSEGQITARDGSVVMVAPQLRHSGRIEARRVGLAAATGVQVDVEGDGLIFFNVRNDGSLDTRLSLLGNVLADGGSAEVRAAARAGFADTVLNLDGIVQARSLGQRQGRVVVDGGRDGITVVSGRIDVSGANAGERGGDAVVTGQKVGIASGATIDASGHDGGGRIRVGGGWQGADAEVANADMTTVQQGARLDARATLQGDGGTVVVWSDQATRYAGHVDARGGAGGGDGGQAEVSGKAYLEFNGGADLSAPQGATGTLLLDPLNIEIRTTGTDLTGPTLDFNTNAGNTSVITTSSIVTQLGGPSNVELQATNNITVFDPVTSPSANALILRANNNITVSAALDIAGGVQLLADNDASGGGRVSVAANVTAGIGADVLISARAGAAGGDTNEVTGTIQGRTATFAGNTDLNLGAQVNTANVLVSHGTLDMGGTTRIATNSTVTVASGASLDLPAGDVTLGALAGAGTVTIGSGQRLTVGTAASTGSTTFSGVIAGAGNARLEKAGASFTFTLTGTSTFGGNTLVSAGTLRLGDGGSLPGDVDITAGATLELSRSGSYTLGNDLSGAGTLRVTAGTVSVRGTNSHAATTVTGGVVNVNAATDRVGALTLDGGTLQLGADGLTLAAPIALGAGGGTIDSNGLAGTFSGGFTGAGSFTKAGTGTLTLTATGHTGNTSVSGGALTLGAAVDLADASTVSVASGATLTLAASDTVGALQLGGTLASTNAGDTLTAGSYALTAGANVNAQLGGGTLTANGATAINRSAGATTVQVVSGTLTLGAPNLLADSADVSVADNATLTLTGDETVGTLALAGTLGPAASSHVLTATTVTLTGDAIVNANLGNGAITSSGAAVQINGTAAGNLSVGAGQLTLGSANRLADGSSVSVASGATLVLGGTDTVTRLTLAGTLAGSGTLTASAPTAGYELQDGALTQVGANLGTGALTSTGATRLEGTSAASTVDVDGGTLTLATADRLTGSAAVTVDLGAALALGANQGIGTLAGAGAVNVGAFTLSVGAASVFDGTLAGTSGGLTANASFTLNGTATYGGTTRASAGVFTLGAADRLADASTLQIDGSGSLALNVSETVATFSLSGSGTASGTGTLTATDYAIGGGTVDLLLGTGTLTATGGTLLRSVGAGVVNVDSGTLVLANANLLGATPTLNVASGATLQISGGQTAGNASIAGTLAGSGTLASTSVALQQGASVSGNLGSGNLVVNGAATLSGTSANASVVVANGGALTLVGAERLLDSAAVTVAAGGTLSLPAAETVGTLSLNGRLAGIGTLTAGTVALNGATVDANLGSGAITSSGSSTLNGTAAGNIDIASGTLTLGSSERLTDTVAVTLQSTGTLLLGGTETVASFTSAGALAGNGTLVATGGHALNGGASTAAGTQLGGGTVTGNGSVTLAGSVAGNLTVAGGTLALSGTDRLAASSAVTVANGATLAMNANQRAASLSGAGTVDVGTSTLTVGATGASSTFDGTLAGSSGGFTKTGSGSFVLVGSAAYSAGLTTVDGGTLVLNSAERLADGSRVAVGASGTLSTNGAERVDTLASAGTLSGTGTVTASQYTLSGGSVSVGLGAGELTASGGTLAGSVGVDRIAVTGTLTVAGSATLTAAPQIDIAGSATLVLNANQNAGAVTIAGTLDGAATLNSTGTTLNGGARVLANLGSGDLAVTGNATLTGSSGAANVAVTGGTLTLDGAERLANSAQVTVAGTATLSLAAGETVDRLTLDGTLAGAGTLNAATVQLRNGAVVAGALNGGSITSGGAVTITNTGSAAGALTVTDGTLTLAGADRLGNASDVTVANGATLALGGNDTVNRLVLAGGLTGSGTLDATTAYTLQTGGSTAAGANLGAGVLTSTGNATLGGSSAAGTVNVAGGTLTLAGTNRLASAADVTVAATATLASTGDLALDRLSGAGNVSFGSATLTVGAAGGSSTFDGTLAAGAGNLVKTGAGTFTLAGSAGHTGTTAVNAGTLVLSGAERLADAGRVTVASGATLAVGGAETVTDLVVNGMLNGAGTLTAATYLLDGGTVNAALGTGTLTSTGGTLNGASAAGSVNVTGGTLVLGSGGRFTAAPALRVDGGATLRLGGNETAGTATLAGTLDRSGTLDTLSAATVTLAAGADVVANLGGGNLVVTGNARLTGTSAATNVAVNGGTLQLAAAERLSNGAAVNIAGVATLALAGDETVASLRLAGTLNGPGKLFAAEYNLAGGTANADLGGGTLRSSGDSRLNGSADALAVFVDDGTLRLGSAERLADAAVVRVERFATLALGGTERVRTLDLAGAVTGGTLTADDYILSGGVIDGDIDGGRLSTSGDSELDGLSSATTVNVNGGTLTLGSGGRFTSRPDVTVAPGATLVMGGDESFGSLAGAGTVGVAGFELTTGAIRSSTFTGVLAGGGDLTKVGPDTTFTLGGTNTLGGTLAVNEGTLALAAGGTLGSGVDVSVARGATLTLAADAAVDRATLAGTLAGSGTLTAPTYDLNGGTLAGRIGAGTLTSRGPSTASGVIGATTVVVADGTLTLVGAGRLGATPAVSVARDAVLQLGGDEGAATLTLAGTLAGSGTLTAARYDLDGGSASADLGAGALHSSGASTLAGRAGVQTVAVDGGTLTLAGAGRLSAAPAVAVADGATLALGGDATLGRLAGLGGVELGTFTLATGSGGDAVFDGVIAGSGSLVKQGAGGFTLSGRNTYTGSTRVDAGTLLLPDGSSLATSGFTVDGTLRFERSDTLTLTQSIGGSGNVEKAGSGRLVLDGSANTYSGQTRVLEGELATAAAERLPDASDIVVAAGARFTLAGAETVNSIASAGEAALAERFTTRGAMVFDGPVRAVGGAPLVLSGTRIEALDDGNDWGARLSLLSGGTIDIAGGRAGDGSWRDLTLGEVDAGAGGRIVAGRITLDGLAQLRGGTLAVESQAAATTMTPDAGMQGRLTPLLQQIAFTQDDIVQNTGARLDVADGALLSLSAPNGGSIRLLTDDNRFAGGVEARSGGLFAAWAGSVPTADGGVLGVQSRIRIAGDTVRVAGAGLEADVIGLRADRLSTAAGATIAARLPFDNFAGSDASLPALTLELTPDAFTLPFPFGQNGGSEISISVGSRAWGNRALPLDSGYITVLPRNGAQGATAVVLAGPLTTSGYRFFFDGAGLDGEIPVFYNGVLPATPQVSGSIAATVAVSEGARKERFDDSVRTENVAVRLRAGVIAEVGPGRPATVGSEGVRTPATCPPDATLACEAAK